VDSAFSDEKKPLYSSIIPDVAWSAHGAADAVIGGRADRALALRQHVPQSMQGDFHDGKRVCIDNTECIHNFG